MGLLSFNASALFKRSSSFFASSDSPFPSARRRSSFLVTSCSLGKNSFNGGSSSLTMTGSPDITLKISMKSPFCSFTSLSKASTLSSFRSAMMTCCIMSRQSASRNICSVRHNPIPLAPSSRACLASSGVSELAHTCNLANLSAIFRNS